MKHFSAFRNGASLAPANKIAFYISFDIKPV